jgi:hypothetical protein
MISAYILCRKRLNLHNHFFHTLLLIVKKIHPQNYGKINLKTLPVILPLYHMMFNIFYIPLYIVYFHKFFSVCKCSQLLLEYKRTFSLTQNLFLNGCLVCLKQFQPNCIAYILQDDPQRTDIFV